jgi:hypothetical protein
VVILHAALWVFAQVFRRTRSHASTVALVLVWVFLTRATMLGFYDAAWLLPGALGIDQMVRKKHGAAIACFLVSALISYRAVSFGVLGAWSFLALVRSQAPIATKLAHAMASAEVGAVVVWAFVMLIRHSPPDNHSADSALLPLSFLPKVYLAIGLLTAGALATISIPLGASVAVASVLAILHAGHNWHACLLIPSMLALPLAPRRPLWATVLLVAWFVFFCRYAFWFDPMTVIDEMLRFAEHGGKYFKEGPLRYFPP